MLFLARKWIAGTTLDSALVKAKKANKAGIHAIIDYVGEHCKKQEEIGDAVLTYISLVGQIRKKSINASISVKPTQLGLSVSRRELESNLKKILAEAENIMVTLDMESFEYVDETIDVFKTLHRQHPNLGITFQANLKRTGKDIEKVLASKGFIRLVKGAYKTTERKGYSDKKMVRKHFVELMKLLFRKSGNFAIATHDLEIINCALVLGAKKKDRFEFQFLMGLRDNCKQTLVREGFRIAEYIPFGNRWFPYFWRRLKERKSNIFLLLGSLIGR